MNQNVSCPQHYQDVTRCVALMLTGKIKQKQIIRQNGNCSKNALHKQKHTANEIFNNIHIYAYTDPGV